MLLLDRSRSFRASALASLGLAIAVGSSACATDHVSTASPDGQGDAEMATERREPEGTTEASGTSASPPSGRASETSATPVKVWLWNVAGHAMHAGSTTSGLVDAAVASIRASEAGFVAFNEICLGQYSAVQRALQDAGWPADPENFARFMPSREAGRGVCAGQAYGNAIFSRAPLGTANRFTLPSDGTAEDRNLLCAPLRDQPRLRLCTTHITTKNDLVDGVPANARQLDDVLARLEEWSAQGDTVLIAGDFNAQPNYARMNRWYSSSLVSPHNADNTGHYRELDDADPDRCPGYGAGTVPSAPAGGPCGTGSKIDLVFAREDRIVGPYSADVLEAPSTCRGPCSDHKIVTGSVTVAVAR